MSVQSESPITNTYMQHIGRYTDADHRVVEITVGIQIKDCNATWSEAIFSKSAEGNVENYVFPIHVPSGEIYNLDCDPVIRFKGIIIPIGIVFVTLQRVIHHLAQAIFYTYRALVEKDPSRQAEMAERRNHSFTAIGYAVGTWLRVSVFAVGMIFLPYTSRRYCYAGAKSYYNYVKANDLGNKYFFPRCIRSIADWDKDTRSGKREFIYKQSRDLDRFQHYIHHFHIKPLVP